MVLLTQSERATLDNSKLFNGVDHNLVNDVLGQCRIRELQPAQVLLSPEQVNHYIYLILSGRFEVHVGDHGKEPLAVLGKGECVGEMSVLDSQKPSAQVIAATPSRVLELHQSLVWQFVDATEGMARNLLYIISSRLRINTNALFESLRRQVQFERFADLDGLTGLHNRRWLDRTLRKYMDASNEAGAPPLAVIILDIDHFKHFNDTHGHPAGDIALRQVAEAISGGLRPADMAARYGGEEFAVILPDSDLEQGLRTAQRLCSVVRTTRLQTSEGTPLPSVSISLGVAEYRPGQTGEQLFEVADTALYRAKEGGRNRAIA